MDFEMLYNSYSMDIYRFTFLLCKNEDMAKEITSETFYRAICSADKFKGDCSVRVWLCQIAKNIFYNIVKREKFSVEMPDDLSDNSDIEDEILDRSQALEIHKILHLLKEPYKEVFYLRLFSQLSFSEIGEIFEKSESWARVTFYRAKNKIREGIKND